MDCDNSQLIINIHQPTIMIFPLMIMMMIMMAHNFPSFSHCWREHQLVRQSNEKLQFHELDGI